MKTFKVAKARIIYDFEYLKRRVKYRANNIKTWCMYNPQLSVPLAVSGVGAVGYIGKAVIKNINLRKQEAIKALYCYDRSLGYYWHLRRELTNKEWLEIDRRKQAGERIADILSEMKVLK